MFEISENENQIADGAKIRVVGIGGGGCNAVNTMIKAGLTGVDYIVANTDSQALNANLAPTKVQLGVELTKGLGAGANPEVGRKAALDEYEKLSEVLEGSDMVFITSGMGGGTGTGAAPVVAKLARELGALTVGVVTKPFLFEGKRRMKQAMAGISTLEETVDSLITIPNQRLLYLAGESLSLVETFKKADEVLLNAVRGISDLINTTGHINADFADVSTVMSNKGLALMGTGLVSGPDRAIKAATEAISSPLLEDISIDGATGIIINITGDESMTMHEVNEAATLIMEAADEDAEVIFGSVVDNNIEDNIKVTVIATGLGGQDRTKVGFRTEAPVRQTETERTPEIHATSTQAEVQHANNHGHDVREQVIATETKSEEYRAERNYEQPVHEETRRPEVRREDHVARSEATTNIEAATRQFDGGSHSESGDSLAASIKEAANRYENQKVERDTAWNSTPSHQATKKSTARTRSIAEKLGFINFDEEELDTPSYLRQDENRDDDSSRDILI